jgi:hypothetical protein
MTEQVEKTQEINRDELEEFQFVALEQFMWVDQTEDSVTHHATYFPGNNTYNCSRFEVHDALREKCAEWEKEGKIKKYPLAPGKKFEIQQHKVEE